MSGLAVELFPLGSTDELAAFFLLMHTHPASTANCAALIASAMPAASHTRCTAPYIKELLRRFDSSPLGDFAVEMVRDDPTHKTVHLVLLVDCCMACEMEGEHVQLRSADSSSSPTVYLESGHKLTGIHCGKKCPACRAWHNMSYAEGGTRIPGGQQLPYRDATARGTRWVQLMGGKVFDCAMLHRLDQQMLHSHTGYETYCKKLVGLSGQPRGTVDAMRQNLGQAWAAWGLLRWREEMGQARPPLLRLRDEMGYCILLGWPPLPRVEHYGHRGILLPYGSNTAIITLHSQHP